MYDGRDIAQVRASTVAGQHAIKRLLLSDLHDCNMLSADSSAITKL